jgi:hypothetical protein
MEHHMENQTMAESFHLSLAHGSELYPNLGQSQEVQLHWNLKFLSMSAARRNNGAHIQSISEKWGDLGSIFSNHEENQKRYN